jgi:hypothetical protein
MLRDSGNTESPRIERINADTASHPRSSVSPFAHIRDPDRRELSSHSETRSTAPGHATAVTPSRRGLSESTRTQHRIRGHPCPHSRISAIPTVASCPATAEPDRLLHVPRNCSRGTARPRRVDRPAVRWGARRGVLSEMKHRVIAAAAFAFVKSDTMATQMGHSPGTAQT